MNFDWFNGEVSASTVASVIAQDLVDAINPAQDVSALITALTGALGALESDYNGVWDAVNIATDLAAAIVGVFPQGNVAEIGSVIATSTSLL